MLTLAAAAAWPLAARAQQAEQTRRVGVLMPFDAQDSFGREIVAALREGLNGRGWTEGRNVRIDARWIGRDDERRSAYAAELVLSSPERAVCLLCRTARRAVTGNARDPHRLRRRLRSGCRGIC